jgi:2,3-bisphosphoglycerate-dependent phosphoglycerate mutase
MSNTDQKANLPTTLLLCRHGESQWNVEGRVQGTSLQAAGLTEQGRWQAARLAERLASAEVSALYSSDLLRAVETAGIVAAALGKSAESDKRWREIDMGSWHGLTLAEIQDRFPEDWAATRLDTNAPRGGGETFATFQARTLQAAAELHARHPGQTVAVITHGGNVRACLLSGVTGPLDPSDPRRSHIPNTSVTAIQVNGGHVTVLSLPDAGHLEVTYAR